MTLGAAKRAGLTLIELMLVLVILVISAAIVVPQLFNGQNRQSLRMAAEKLNGELVATRQQSMSEGLQLLLLYQQGTPFYAVVAEPIDDETRTQFETVTTTLSQFVGGLDEETEFVATVDGAAGVRRLPVGSRFFEGEAGTAQVTDTTGIQAEIAGLPYVAFSPDGTTDDAILELVNDDFDRISIRMRGLTGTARVGEIISGQSLGQSSGQSTGGGVQP